MTTPPANSTAIPVFEVSQAAFSGPFELLLSLIARKKLDITELALAEVADDFIAYLRVSGFDLERATEFLVVAATLLDLKAARLLPVEVRGDDDDDFALLEERDLLFARLMQYRAYKRAAELLSGLELLEQRYIPRQVSLEERFVAVLPEVVLGLTPVQFHALADQARQAKPRRRWSRWITSMHRGWTCVPTPASSSIDCRRSAPRRSRCCASDASRRSKSWRASWHCWSSVAKAESASSSPRRSVS